MKKISYSDIISLGVESILISGSIHLGYFIVEKTISKGIIILFGIGLLLHYWYRCTEMMNLKYKVKSK